MCNYRFLGFLAYALLWLGFIGPRFAMAQGAAAQEDGALDSQFNSYREDFDRDGRYDTFWLNFGVQGNVGQAGGYVIYRGFDGPNDDLETAIRLPSRYFRNAQRNRGRARISVPNETGTYTVRICGFDPVAEEATLCAEPHTFEIVDGPIGTVLVRGLDPANEEGTINARQYYYQRDLNRDGRPDTMGIEFGVEGNIGKVSGYAILHGFEDALEYRPGHSSRVPSRYFRSAQRNRARVNIRIPDQAGEYKIQICGWDGYRERITTCARQVVYPIVEGPEGTARIYGADPEDEAGSLNGRQYYQQHDRNGDGRPDTMAVQFGIEGNVGRASGYVVLHGFEDTLEYREGHSVAVSTRYYRSAQRGYARVHIPIPEQTGDYNIQVCGWDGYRGATTICGAPVTYRIVNNPQGTARILGSDPADEVGDIGNALYRHPGPDHDGDGRPDTFATRWTVDGTVGQSSGYAVVLGDSRELSAETDTVFFAPRAYRNAASRYGARLSMPVPDRVGTHWMKVCGWDQYRQRTMTCSGTTAVKVIEGEFGPVVLYSPDPADETGDIDAQQYVWPGDDANDDGRPDTFGIQWTVDGTIGESSGYVLLYGQHSELSVEQDTVITTGGTHRNAASQYGARHFISVPETAGVYYVKACGWDRYRQQTTICSEAVQITVVDGAGGTMVLYGEDPALEDGAVTAQLYGPAADTNGDGLPNGFLVAHNSHGTVGRANQFVIVHGFSADPTYGHDTATFTASWAYPYGRTELAVPDRAGFYRFKACGWDRYRHRTTVCSEIQEVIVVEGAEGLFVLYGDDPQNETGTLTVTGVSTANPTQNYQIRVRGTGSLGQTSGYVLLHSASDATLEDAERALISRRTHREVMGGGHEVTLPTPAEAGDSFIGVCAWDHYRQRTHHCSEPTRVKVIDGARGLVAIAGTDPRDETGEIVANHRAATVTWTRTGDMGNAGGYVITREGEDGPRIIERVSTRTRSASVAPHLGGGTNHISVCAWDPYREETTQCSDATIIRVEQMRDGRPMFIEGQDVREQEGEIVATLHRDLFMGVEGTKGDVLRVEWSVDGDLGAESGFVVVYARDPEPTYPRDAAVFAAPDARTAKVPTVLFSGDYYVRVCAWDADREEAAHCSNIEHTVAFGHETSNACLQRHLDAGGDPNSGAMFDLDIITEAPRTVALPQWQYPELDAEPTETEAARFLTQATFGPNLTAIQDLQAIGYRDWLADQMRLPVSVSNPWLKRRTCSWTKRAAPWGRHAVEGDDQLRQRMAFALSQLLVVSDNGQDRYDMAGYYDLLARNAFGNFRTLLGEAMRSPILGDYLNVLQSRKANPETGNFPNEDLARELMQLFTIGLFELNPDGTEVTDEDGDPVASYGEADVFDMARSLTGRRFGGANVHRFSVTTTTDENAHDTDPKTILGVDVPGGLDVEAELNFVLDIVFHHPNTGPYVGKHLIQRFVTSNPTPEYVARVTAVFDDNGEGVRGDLAAVLQAVLLDTEARNGHRTMPETFGKVREPLLAAIASRRAFNAWDGAGWSRGGHRPRDMASKYGQAPLFAKTVFGFFRPDHVPFALRNEGLVAPEMMLLSTGQLSKIQNIMGNSVNRHHDTPGVGSRLDLDEMRPLFEDPEALVERLNLLLLAGQMDDELREILVNVCREVPVTAPRSMRLTRPLSVLLTTPDFHIQR